MFSLGMITTHRPGLDVHDSVAQVRAGGFQERLHLFCEPDTPELRPMCDVTVHRNPVRRGGVGNWAHCLEWLFANTAAEHLVVCEDDVRFCHGARTAVEIGLRRFPRFGFMSLYTPRRDAPLFEGRKGWAIYNRGRDTWGTQATCFTRESAEQLLRYAPLRNEDQLRGPTDYIVAECFQFDDTPCLHHNPSLVDHIGRISSVGRNWHDEHTGLEFDPAFSPLGD